MKLLTFFFVIMPLAAQYDLTKITKEIAARSEGASSYSLEGEMTVQGQRGMTPGRLLAKAKVKLAVAQPGKSFLEIDAADKDSYQLISNGEKSWAYVPKAKQYTEEEGALRDDDEEQAGDERDLAEVFARLMIPTLARLYKTAEGADMKEYGEVRYGGKKERWPILRVLSKKEGRDGQNLVELTLDPATLRIGRMLWANVTYEDGERTVIQADLVLTKFSIGDPIPETTFRFDPPKNAKLVDAVPIPGQTGSFLLNRPAPDFQLKTLEGETVRLSDLRGKPVMLTFWASWCGPCRRELPELADLYDEYKRKGLVVLGINDEGRGTARKYSSDAGLSFPTLDDGSRRAHNLYRVRAIPSAYLIDGEGKVVRFLRGARSKESLRAALKSLGL